MNKITLECVEQELESLLENGSFSYSNLERLNTLCKAKKHLCHMHHGFTEADAKEWVKHMDPPAKWSMDQTTAVMKQRGYDHDPCEFYAVTNAMYSDYGKTIAKYNMDKPELWADMAHDFICDADAAEGKVGRYFRDIVRH
ncbi:MAG: hypothetical protein UEP57_00550 [Oscillospiraceae bacterium]|nr:hypothetical protein [Oscillospiraceae bacterium]